MRPLIISGATSVLGLQQEIQRSEESRYDHRLHGVLLVAQGMTCPEVARLLGDAPRSVENWVHRFDQEGLAGLTEGERSGRPSRLDEKQVKEINRMLRSKPSDAGMRVNLWDGKTLSAWIDRPMARKETGWSKAALGRRHSVPKTLNLWTGPRSQLPQCQIAFHLAALAGYRGYFRNR